MGGATVAQTVGRQAFVDAGSQGCLTTSQPDHVGGDGDVGALATAGKQISLGFSPAPVKAQGFQQFGTQGHVTVAAAFTVNADHHALTIDVTDLETAKF